MTEKTIIIKTVLKRDFIVYIYFDKRCCMNFFQVIPKVVFIETEEDLNFVKEQAEQKGYRLTDFCVGSVVSFNQTENVYVVKPLDTLESISKKLNISISDLKQKLGTTNVFIGQKIKF